jgi:hypothetical protein
MKLAPENLQWIVDLEFIKQNWRVLNSTRLPWRIPEWLGGLGLTGPGSREPSRVDRQIAHRILMNWKTERPIPINKANASWNIRRLAEKRMVEPYYTSRREFSGVEQWNALVGKKCIDLLFDSDVHLSDLLVETDPQEGMKRTLRHNERLWSPRQWMPEPIEMNRLEFFPYFDSALPDPYTLSRHSHPSPQVGDLD